MAQSYFAGSDSLPIQLKKYKFFNELELETIFKNFNDLHFAKNLSSCRMHTAFRHSSVASSNDHKVNIFNF